MSTSLLRFLHSEHDNISAAFSRKELHELWLNIYRSDLCLSVMIRRIGDELCLRRSPGSHRDVFFRKTQAIYNEQLALPRDRPVATSSAAAAVASTPDESDSEEKMATDESDSAPVNSTEPSTIRHAAVSASEALSNTRLGRKKGEE